MIHVASKFIAEHVPELWGSLSLESVKLTVEIILCAPPMESAYKGQIEKEFWRHGLCWKQDTLHLVPCNCKIAAAHAKQNVIDHLIIHTHDRNLLASCLTSEFQFALLYHERQQHVERVVNRRQSAKHDGVNCSEKQKTAHQDKAARRQRFKQDVAPPFPPPGLFSPVTASPNLQTEKVTLVKCVPQLWLTARLPVHATERVLERKVALALGSAEPYTCVQCGCKQYLWSTHCGGCAFCLGTTNCPA